MSNSNKTYRINTKIGTNDNISLNLNVLQKYDILEILSLKIGTEGLYKTHTSGYGCVVGRVLANGGVGIPNAKISIFIESNENVTTNDVLYSLYPYKTTSDKNSNYVRYNLLPDEKVSECHQNIGVFPSKRLVLDDKNILEVFDKYYKFTTVTNESGDYMLFGVPTGNQIIHMDLDLSDIGFLSQKPVDMKFKGYNNTFFENAKQFKTDTNIDNLAQVMSQSAPVYIKPFWGEENGEELGITRHDIDVNYKFEPTCIFMGSMVSDSNDNAFSKKCIPSRNMGKMNSLITGRGTIEMIRKKIDGSVEEYPIMGNRVIDENGVWCYQIPMNLDYVITDEYGNLVPTDNPDKGLPTRTRVRFRLSKSDYESDYSINHLTKVLIPNNPKNPNKIDYVFGSNSEDSEDGTESFRDLFWGNVYTVKSHIPRIQKGNNQRTEKFSGIKNVNVNEGKNPIPYNNMRVNISFIFSLQCGLFKALIFSVKLINKIFDLVTFRDKNKRCVTIGGGMCPDLEGWYFAPGCKNEAFDKTYKELENDNDIDEESIDYNNRDDDYKNVCLTNNTNYFLQCIEINLALENNVIQFDFYNDWINGLIYLPRWQANIKRKKSFFFNLIKIKPRVQACTEDSFNNSRRYVQQCAMEYNVNDNSVSLEVNSKNGCHPLAKVNKCHKANGRKHVKIFGTKGGLVHEEKTMKGLNAYYLKPCEILENGKKCNLYATDIVLLGNINKCNMYGIPSEFNDMLSTTYQMPPVLAQTNMDSDGVLYGVAETGKSKCNPKRSAKGIKPSNQTFNDYEIWSEENENDNNGYEYAVTEISGIDWGLSGPNQGDKNYDKLYFPGGHFLGISCANSEVNIKSCINLSRICECGVSMSQRQIKPLNFENEELTYKYFIPTGFISKDEINDGNFRDIFASLNYNKLKTQKNDFGLREYEFISLQPINFNGELNKQIRNNNNYNNEKEDNSEENPTVSAKAFVRTLENNSKEYTLFRFGIYENDKTSNKLSDKFLGKTSNGYYIPTYENSYYFYYGLKNGATALDIFLNEYFAECPSRGENFQPTIKIETKDEVICNEKGSATLFFKNIATPLNYTIYKNNSIIESKNGYELNKVELTNLSNGVYEVVVEQTKMGVKINKEFEIYKYLPSIDEHNIYKNSCIIETINFIETPKVQFDKGNFFTHKLKDNGGIITLKLPKYSLNKKPPYIYGFAVTCDNYCVCCDMITNPKDSGMIFKTLTSKTGYNFTQIINNINEVKSENSLYSLDKDNSLNYLIKDDTIFITFKGWQIDSDINLYVCYGCSSIPNDKNLNILFIDRNSIGVDNIRMSYYLYNNNVLLSDIDHNSKNGCEIFSEVESGNTEIVKINYNNISGLTPYEEWAIKRALYYTNSMYDENGNGSIEYGVVGGTTPYNIRIRGASEIINDDGKITLEDDIDSSKNTDYEISTDFFKIPTLKWVHNDIDKKQPYIISVEDANKIVPYMSTKIFF